MHYQHKSEIEDKNNYYHYSISMDRPKIVGFDLIDINRTSCEMNGNNLKIEYWKDTDSHRWQNIFKYKRISIQYHFDEWVDINLN